MLKKTKQARSKEIVAKILDAAEQTIIEMGIKDMTTNHIAEAAGVSNGSLYQFFPNKEALISAMIKKLSEENYVGLKKCPTP